MAQPSRNIFATDWGIVIAGLVIGGLAVFLQKMGNPGNMGICVACFERDITLPELFSLTSSRFRGVVSQKRRFDAISIGTSFYPVGGDVDLRIKRLPGVGERHMPQAGFAEPQGEDSRAGEVADFARP